MVFLSRLINELRRALGIGHSPPENFNTLGPSEIPFCNSEHKFPITVANKAIAFFRFQ